MGFFSHSFTWRKGFWDQNLQVSSTLKSLSSPCSVLCALQDTRECGTLGNERLSGPQRKNNLSWRLAIWSLHMAAEWILGSLKGRKVPMAAPKDYVSVFEALPRQVRWLFGTLSWLLSCWWSYGRLPATPCAWTAPLLWQGPAFSGSFKIFLPTEP